MNKEVKSDQLMQIKEKISASESAIKKVSISAITVDPKALAQGCIFVNKNKVRVSNTFFSKLGSFLKVNSSLTKDMIKKGDTMVAAALINGLKDYQSVNKKERDVILIANVKSREIIDICSPSRYKKVTNETIFDVTERILNENSNLIIETVDFNPNTGGTSINFLNDQEVEFAQAGKDEFFKFGFSIIQTNKDTTVETYNQRLICSNGLRASLGEGAIGANNNISFEEKFRLDGTSSEDIRIFLNKIGEMSKAGFKPAGFETAINKAIRTKASLNEVASAINISTKKLKDPDEELLKQYKASLIRQYFPGLNSTLARINRKGVNSDALLPRQKMFIKTSMSIWDVVNSMTFLGSNNTGFPIDNQHELKYEAGKLFSKGVNDGFDLEFAQYAQL